MTPSEALKTYYGYDDFRPLQSDIIASVLDGKDTLALLPTGGGKSLCFQIPTLCVEGLCLVVTPLIALMRDQVQNLCAKDIRAVAIYSGMTLDQQRIALDNCLYGPYRFLYVSPERLESEDFRKRISQLPITLIAVDEAHCISQWGYDFRPAYLRIADIRKHVPSATVLALTATATPEVVEDIQNQLGFAEKNVFQSSFQRKNLQYIVRYIDQREKANHVLHILKNVAGSAIVYVRNRKNSKELSDWLLQQGESVDFYHAGLLPQQRHDKQTAWRDGKIRTIVCTNAFGMGIDKPDVRVVIHYDLPDTIEAYFQEAGRAGRDGKTSYCVMLYDDREDRMKARKRIADNFPDKEFVAKVYQYVCDYLVVGEGSGLGHTWALHLDEICAKMHLPLLQTYSALHILDQAGYIRFEEDKETRPRIQFNCSPGELNRMSLTNEERLLVDGLLRKYPGIFTDLQYLQEDAHQLLSGLAARGILTYIPRTVASMFTLIRERQSEISLPANVYEQRRDHYVNGLRQMVEYASQNQFCRQQVLLSYFGENDAPCCGTCDVCRAK